MGKLHREPIVVNYKALALKFRIRTITFTQAPKHPGLEALRELSTPAEATPVRVILLTAAIEKGQIVEALQLGARGVVLKDSATQVLLKAMQMVMAGEYWVQRESVSNLVQYLRTLMRSTDAEDHRRKFGLTPRQLEIVSAVVAGYSN